ncbi:MAG: 16S rRNA (guanine(527)-N(7))-methyltransferase RsmG [Proteobacteria bacterium]|nr:16S rRNA (guanine(527)-N(7))-methyltransferase RsmG [Pseudomonadota bacterium]
MTLPTRAPMTSQDFQQLTNVSHETLQRLEAYLDLLAEWNKAVGLVSRSSLQDPWRRHILDCAQLFQHLASDADRPIVDIGSGAGLPGLILSILGCPEIHLIEANGRKAVFLQEAARRLDAKPIIHAVRVEDLAPFPAAVVTARAVASIESLIEMAMPFLTSDSRCLFLKGQDMVSELTEAEKRWRMQSRRITSLSDPEGTLLEIRLPTLAPTLDRIPGP